MYMMTDLIRKIKRKRYKIKNSTYKKGNKAVKRVLCKFGIHFYKYRFIEYADQPFEDDDMCVTEGYHTYQCKLCGKEKPYFKF